MRVFEYSVTKYGGYSWEDYEPPSPTLFLFIVKEDRVPLNPVTHFPRTLSDSSQVVKPTD